MNTNIQTYSFNDVKDLIKDYLSRNSKYSYAYHSEVSKLNGAINSFLLTYSVANESALINVSFMVDLHCNTPKVVLNDKLNLTYILDADIRNDIVSAINYVNATLGVNHRFEGNVNKLSGNDF